MIPGLGRCLGEGKGLPTPVFWPGEFHGLYSNLYYLLLLWIKQTAKMQKLLLWEKHIEGLREKIQNQNQF